MASSECGASRTTIRSVSPTEARGLRGLHAQQPLSDAAQNPSEERALRSSKTGVSQTMAFLFIDALDAARDEAEREPCAMCWRWPSTRVDWLAYRSISASMIRAVPRAPVGR